jgi:transposase
MEKPYSDDLRERAVAAIESGHTREEVAELYNLAPSTAATTKMTRLAPHTDLVRKLVAEQPDSTLAELKARFAKEKIKVSQSAIFRFLLHLRLPFKKRVSSRPNRIGRTSLPLVRPCGKHNRPSETIDVH